MRTFLQSLRGSGDLVVSSGAPPVSSDEAAAALAEHEALFRLEIPPGAPSFDVEAAYWGARKLYQACQLLVLRDTPPDAVRATLEEPFDGVRSPSTDYSVDLTFQYLPSLARLAERVAPEDPLLDSLDRLGADWPLSSVGMRGVEPPDETRPFLSQPCLLRLYIERIVEAKDFSRIVGDRMKAHARAALGAYPELQPELARHCASS